MVNATGRIEPAPNPWIKRNRISAGIELAKPQAIEPARNSTTPNINTGRRP
jgi:hypothetical protein